MQMGLLANAGTPLMWAPIGHLLFGNVLIALLEALAIRLIFRLHFGRVFVLAVAANFLSMAAGFWLLPLLIEPAQPLIMGTPPIFGLRRYIISLVVAAFVMSLLVEWPILRWSVNKPWRTVARTGAIALVAQVVSHTLLVPYYLAAGANTISDEAKLQRANDFASRPDWWVYYVSPENQVRRIRVGGGDDELMNIAIDPREAITIEPAGKRLALLLRRMNVEDGELLIADLGPVGPPRDPRAVHVDPFWGRGAIDLRPAPEQHADAWPGTWAAEGLIFESSRHRGNLAVELPFLTWYVRCVTILPGDQVIFQIGPQVALFDLHTQQLTVLAMGRSPAVLPAESAAPATAPTTTAPASPLP